MELKWTEFAIDNLEAYQKSSKKTSQNLTKYYKSLIESINLLPDNPKLGRKFYRIEDYTVRQLLHREHRILYLIEDNTIVVLSLVHTTYPLNEALRFIKRYISKL